MRKNITSNKTGNKKIKPPAYQAQSKKEIHSLLIDRLRISLLVIMGAITLFLLLSLFSYNINDPAWKAVQIETLIYNYAGISGAYTANIILAICGIFGFLMPFFLIYGIWQLLLKHKKRTENIILLMVIRFSGAILLLLSGSGLAQIALPLFSAYMPEGAGGILGQEIAKYTILYFNKTGSVLVLVVAFSLGLTLFSGGFWIRSTASLLYFILITSKECLTSLPEKKSQKLLKNIKLKTQKKIFKQQTTENSELLKPQKLKQQTDEPATSYMQQKKCMKNKNKTDRITGLPSLDLLDSPDPKKEQVSKEFMQKMALLIEEKLADFGMYVKVVGSYSGPVITLFEIELAPGTKVNKLSGLARDLARSLSAPRVRVVEVIPGKPYVGIELPNQKRKIVRLKEVLSHKNFTESTSPLTIGLGVNIEGIPETSNLAKMPHLLVAGTTGSGKSIGVNAMIISMLYKSAPDDLRLIMIDPKMLELSVYEGIPHLLTPVVTDMNEAANALRWCVKEMDRRYELMAAVGIRNIASFNEKVVEAKIAGEPIKNPLWLKQQPETKEHVQILKKLPYIVIIADEFADMIMVVGKKVEELIARLAQKARASGIHLILATQRPSVDVITGLIKANIPTRIAFQVSSKIDSRTILDQQGAEQLLGDGDMLYLIPGAGVPSRLHGAFVDDNEVHRVVSVWKKISGPEYINSITTSKDEEKSNQVSKDPLYNEAVQIVLKTQRASISNIQRRLCIGYNRSARLIDEMEALGIVSKIENNSMRTVLIKR